MGEVRSENDVALVWSDLARQCLVGETVFDIYSMEDGMAPVLRREVILRENFPHHIGKCAVWALYYCVLK